MSLEKTDVSKCYIKPLEGHLDAFDGINQYIQQYNDATNKTDKIERLKLLDQAQKKIDGKYRDSEISAMPKYCSTIYGTLFRAMKDQRKELGVRSDYTSLTDPRLLLDAAELINNLPQETIATILRVLSSPLDLTGIGSTLIHHTPNNDDFHTFVKDHDIESIGGNNSKSYSFKDKKTGYKFVLKVEQRFDRPKDIERELRSEDTILVTQWADRRVEYEHLDNGKIAGTLSLIDYSKGRTLEHMYSPNAGIKERQALAVDMAIAQLLLHKKMHAHQKAWPDAKGSNIFFRRDSKTQRMIAEVADCKAFYRCNTDGLLIVPAGEYVIRTNYSSAPEVGMKPMSIQIDKMDMYTIGRNLYESLWPFSVSKLRCDVSEFRDDYFQSPIFNNSNGNVLKTLIQAVVKFDPNARLSSDQLLRKLISIKYNNNRAYLGALHKLELISVYNKGENFTKTRAKFIINQYERMLNQGHQLSVINKDLDDDIGLIQLEKTEPLLVRRPTINSRALDVSGIKDTQLLAVANKINTYGFRQEHAQKIISAIELSSWRNLAEKDVFVNSMIQLDDISQVKFGLNDHAFETYLVENIDLMIEGDTEKTKEIDKMYQSLPVVYEVGTIIDRFQQEVETPLEQRLNVMTKKDKALMIENTMSYVPLAYRGKIGLDGYNLVALDDVREALLTLRFQWGSSESKDNASATYKSLIKLQQALGQNNNIPRI